ncbi:hypothetical protein SY88_11990 [Clostridiales bacterium PH28_bin88]|nr:hypothetical protein SY88_11990 [Clostridiales bacterium PH28_bin88]
MALLLATLVLLSVVFSYALAAYLMLPFRSRLPVRWYIFWTAVFGTLLAVAVGTLVFISVWPPVSFVSGLVWLGLVGLVLRLALSGNGEGGAGASNDATADDSRASLRSGYGV